MTATVHSQARRLNDHSAPFDCIRDPFNLPITQSRLFSRWSNSQSRANLGSTKTQHSRLSETLRALMTLPAH